MELRQQPWVPVLLSPLRQGLLSAAMCTRAFDPRVSGVSPCSTFYRTTDAPGTADTRSTVSGFLRALGIPGSVLTQAQVLYPRYHLPRPRLSTSKVPVDFFFSPRPQKVSETFFSNPCSFLQRLYFSKEAFADSLPVNRLRSLYLQLITPFGLPTRSFEGSSPVFSHLDFVPPALLPSCCFLGVPQTYPTILSHPCILPQMIALTQFNR